MDLVRPPTVSQRIVQSDCGLHDRLIRMQFLCKRLLLIAEQSAVSESSKGEGLDSAVSESSERKQVALANRAPKRVDE